MVHNLAFLAAHINNLSSLLLVDLRLSLLVKLDPQTQVLQGILHITTQADFFSIFWSIRRLQEQSLLLQSRSCGKYPFPEAGLLPQSLAYG